VPKLLPGRIGAWRAVRPDAKVPPAPPPEEVNFRCDLPVKKRLTKKGRKK
jgi:hypothetical protein